MARTFRLAAAVALLAALAVGTGTVAADSGNKILDTRLVGVPTPPGTMSTPSPWAANAPISCAA